LFLFGQFKSEKHIAEPTAVAPLKRWLLCRHRL